MNFFVDSNQTLFDDLAQPLNGRVAFLDYNTSEPKAIFEDSSLDTPASNPQYTNISSTLEKQIFLDFGTYKVRYEKYIGNNDPKTAPDSDFVAYKTIQLDGRAAIGTGSDVVYNVNTIADLRLVDTNEHTIVQVQGYYDVTDKIAPRTYIWVASNTQADNFGTIIQKTGVNTGRWLMLEPTIIDSRYFGVFPSATETYNSELTALISWAASSYAKNKTIQFSQGTYSFIAGTFTFTNKVIIEKNVKFALIGSDSLNINFNSDYDIKTDAPLVVNSAALLKVIISFNGLDAQKNRYVVKSNWYGNWDETSDANSLMAMTSRIASDYTLLITSPYKATAGTYDFVNDLKFGDSGKIIAAGGAYNFTNIKISHRVKTARFELGTGGAWTNFTFNNCEIYSSLFSNSINQGVITGIQTNATNTVFTFDNNALFTGAFTDNGGMTYKHKSGLITADLTNTFAVFNSFEASNKQVFSNLAYVGLKNQDSKISYFLPTSATTEQQTNALYSTIRSAIAGNGVADFGKRVVEVKAINTLYSGIYRVNAIESLTIKNATFNITEALTLFAFNVSTNKLNLENLSISSTTSAAFKTLELINGVLIKDVNFENVKIYDPNLVGTTVTCTNGSSILSLKMNKCDIHTGVIANESTKNEFGIRNVFLTNNKFYCGFRAINAGCMINNNQISCNPLAAAWFVNPNGSSIVNANRFFETVLYLDDNNAVIDHVVTSNQFESTSGNISKIVIRGTSTATKLLGLNITANSFIGPTLPSLTTMIESTGSFGGTHRFNIGNNTSCGVENNYLVPRTKGSWKNAVVNRYNGDYKFYLQDNPEVFLVPGGVCNINSFQAVSIIGMTGNIGALTGRGSLVETDDTGAYIALTFQNNGTLPLDVYVDVTIDLY